MSLSEAFKEILEEDIRHALKSAELWKRYAEAGEFRSEEGKKAILAMGEHFRNRAATTRARLKGMPTTANPLGTTDTEFPEKDA